jgi:hypothetical protein
MIEADGASRSSLVSQVAGSLQSEKGKQLFTALVQAQERGGSRAVKDLITNALNQEKALREEDGEEEDEQ